MTIQIRQCIHTKRDGAQCGSPALRGKTRCYYHVNPAKPRRAPALDVPDLNEPRAVIYVVNQIFRGLIHGNMDRKQASAMLYALQIAQKEKSG